MKLKLEGMEVKKPCVETLFAAPTPDFMAKTSKYPVFLQSMKINSQKNSGAALKIGQFYKY